MQLLIEQSLAAYIALQNLLPANYRTYPAHGAEVINADQQDYLRIVASRPANQTGGVGEFPVELQLFTGGAEDEAKLAALTLVHDTLGLGLYGFFVYENLQEVLAALNAPLVEGVLFSGWQQDGGTEDGRTGSQLVARLRYKFWVAPAVI